MRSRGSKAISALSHGGCILWSRCLLFSCCFLINCSGSGGGGASEPPPTLILIDPAEFADNVACAAGQSSMQVYVATLTDVTGDYDGSVPTMSSAPPTACNLAVGFGYVAPGRKYQARIDAYDRSDISPLTEGSSIMKVNGGGAATLVEPRWTATCGAATDDGAASAGASTVGSSSSLGPAEAFEESTVTVRGCTPFVE